MSNDVPAAHSMDTQWFAVDSEGRVAIFDTGEDGALPLNAANLGGPSKPNFDSLVFEAAMLVRAQKGQWTKRVTPPLDEKKRLMIVKKGPALDPAHFEEIATDPYWVGLSKEPMRYTKLPGWESFELILTDDEIGPEGGFEGDEEEGPASGGFIHFNRDHGDEPGLYERTQLAPDPIKLDALPQSAREAISGLRLPVDFTQTEKLHLGDHLKDSEAAYWGDWSLRGFGDDNVKQPPPVRTPQQPVALWPWIVLGLLVLAALVKFLRS